MLASRPGDSRSVQIIRAHQWDPRAKGCICGWTQRGVLPRRAAGLNHPNHVEEKLREAGVLNGGAR